MTLDLSLLGRIFGYQSRWYGTKDFFNAILSPGKNELRSLKLSGWIFWTVLLYLLKKDSQESWHFVTVFRTSLSTLVRLLVRLPSFHFYIFKFLDPSDEIQSGSKLKDLLLFILCLGCVTLIYRNLNT